MNDLSGRTFLVTGASRGIGRAISLRLLEVGAEVIGIARHFEPDTEALSRFHPLSLDLSKVNDLTPRLQQVLKAHPAIDGVVSNAGAGRFGALEQFSPEQIREMVDLNLIQHILLARCFLPLFKRRGRGDLIFMGSEAALAGGARGTVYSACKFGLRGLAQALRQECAGAGVRIGIINPGMVDSDFFDRLDFAPGNATENRIPPEEVANAVMTFLTASPATVIDEINLSPLRKKVVHLKRPGQ